MPYGPSFATRATIPWFMHDYARVTVAINSLYAYVQTIVLPRVSRDKFVAPSRERHIRMAITVGDDCSDWKKKQKQRIIVLPLGILNRIEKRNGIRRWQVTLSANAHILEVSFRLSIIINDNNTYARERTLFSIIINFRLFRFLSTELLLLLCTRGSKCQVRHIVLILDFRVYSYSFFPFWRLLGKFIRKNYDIRVFCRYVN